MRIGLLGTGPWARIAHAPALSAHDGLDFVGVWGRRPAAARELADAHGTRAYEDVDALLADVDAVAVALPPEPEAPAPVHRFRATGDPEPFARLGRRFLGPEIGTVTTLGAA